MLTDSTGGYTWVVGEPYAGKTALLAAVATELHEAGDTDVVCYFMSHREANADGERLLSAVVPQLAALLDEPPPVADSINLQALWERACDRAESTGRTLLLIVDGLDEERPYPGRRLPAYGLLPSRVSGRVAVLLSTRPGFDMSELPLGHPIQDHRRIDLPTLEEPRRAAVLARREMDTLLDSADDDAVDILALLAAAGGPIGSDDLLQIQQTPAEPHRRRRLRRILRSDLAHSLERVGPPDEVRYQFRHLSLLEHARKHPDLGALEVRQRIHAWARGWSETRWDPARTPAYLLDTYPATLVEEPGLLYELTQDVNWLVTALPVAGVDTVIAFLRRVDGAGLTDADRTAHEALVGALSGQASQLRGAGPQQRLFVARQLMFRALEDSAGHLAGKLHTYLSDGPGPHLYPFRTTRHREPALLARSGRLDGVRTMAALPDGRVVAGLGERLVVWNPAEPSAATELSRHTTHVSAVDVLPDGRVAAIEWDGRGIWVHDLAEPDGKPVELGRAAGTPLPHKLGPDPANALARLRELRNAITVHWMAALSDGCIVTDAGGSDGRLVRWDPHRPGADPIEVGRHDAPLRALVALPDGRLATVTGEKKLSPVGEKDESRVWLWDSGMRPGPPMELGRHWAAVTAVAALADGRVVTGHRTGHILLWDSTAPSSGPVEIGTHPDSVSAIAVLDDGRLLTAGEWGGWLLVRNPDEPGVSRRCLGRQPGGVSAMTVLGRQVVSGNSELMVWDSDERYLTDRRVPVMTDPTRNLFSNPDHGYLTRREPPGDVHVRELGHYSFGSNTVAQLTRGFVATAGVGGWAWSPTGDESGEEFVFCTGPISFVGLAAVFPDGRYVLCDKDGHLTLLDPNDSARKPIPIGRRGTVATAMAALPDGRVVTASESRSKFRSRILVWHPDAPDPVDLGEQPTATAIAVLPDGRVATGALLDDRIRLWDPNDAGRGSRELGRHDTTYHVSALAVLADGGLVSASRTVVQLWDPSTGEVRARINCPVESLATAAVGEDASVIAIAHPSSDWSLWFYGEGYLMIKENK
ncbi:NACHT domain-containing protein [Streptomyces collinus]